MSSKYDPHIDAALSAFSDPHCRIYEFYIPANFSCKKFRERARFRGYLWVVSQDGNRIVVFRRA
jgi:hypothetical protein